jgi:hypothetical protein
MEANETPTPHTALLAAAEALRIAAEALDSHSDREYGDERYQSQRRAWNLYSYWTHVGTIADCYQPKEVSE